MYVEIYIYKERAKKETDFLISHLVSVYLSSIIGP